MKMQEASQMATKVLEFLDTLNLKADEKIATLGAARATVEQVLSAEVFTVKMRQLLDNPSDK